MPEHHTNFKIRTIVPINRKLKYQKNQIYGSSSTNIQEIIDEHNLDAENKVKSTWESSFKPREVKHTMEDSREGLKQKQHVRSIVWLGLKGIILVICIACLFYQSVQFYVQYSTYPTKTSIMINIPDKYMKPAVTFCDRNPVPRSEFCSRYPDFCEKPNDLTKFCQNEPHFCKGNVSNLMIPKFGYFTQNKSEEVEKIAWELLLNSRGKRSSVFEKNDTYLESITFAYDETLGTVAKCISSNLHISGKSEPRTNPLHLLGAINHVNQFTLYLEEKELFYPWLTHQVFFAIHSPLDPINPFNDGRAMKPGYHYKINIRLEEERLLPHPYETNCTDYEAMWKKNNKTGPRSQKMCRYMCSKNFFKILYGCEENPKMLEDIQDWCCPREICGRHTHGGLKHGTGIQIDKRDECFGNCKEECLKVNYLSTIEESVYEPRPSEAIEWTKAKRELTVVTIIIGDLEKTIIYHDPLYSIENLFSNIGGLMGCWLGISVWAFVNIVERTKCLIINWMEKIKIKKQENTDDDLFDPNYLNVYHK